MIRNRREVRLHHALITVGLVIAIVFAGIALLGITPQIPLVFACLVAGLMAFYLGWTWDEILDGMLAGITDSLEAILILLCIGMLVGSWIAAGTVPAMICYGLAIVSPKVFLPAVMLLCMIIAFAIGSWGTVGTLGLAFMGIGLALGVPAPLTAGAVVSGSYMGEVISPLSDATNLAAGVTGADVFSITKKILPRAAIAGMLALGLYLVFSLKVNAGDAQAVEKSVTPLLTAIHAQFKISPFALIPLVVVTGCILFHMPAIPSMLLGAMTGMFFAAALQGQGTGQILTYACEGYVSRSGNELVDALLCAGGLVSMMDTVSVILLAMAFGGIMKKTGQMEVLVASLLRCVRGMTGLRVLTVCTCGGLNVVLPDQYLSISMPGQMYAQAYDRRGISRIFLAAVLLGGAVTSPLVPWNTCGMYCSSILGVHPGAYLPYAFFCLLLPLVVILLPEKKTPQASRVSGRGVSA